MTARRKGKAGQPLALIWVYVEFSETACSPPGCLLPKENSAIASFPERNIAWIHGQCLELTLRLGTGTAATLWGCSDPAPMGDDLRVVALVEESQAPLGYLVLKEQWRTRGNRGLGFFQGFLMNVMRKMEKITFFEPVLWSAGC